MQTIMIATTIDITPTGVRNKIDDVDWLLKRNQQRNHDTLLQVIGLRTQPLAESCCKEKLAWIDRNQIAVDAWHLKFTVDRSDVLGAKGELFLRDIDGIPIVPGLTETTPSFPPQFITRGPFKNIDIFIWEI